MKKIKFIALATLLMSFSCEKEELKQDCDCITTYYTLPIGNGSSQYQWYRTDYDENNLLDCSDAMPNIIPVGDGVYWYQITCE